MDINENVNKKTMRKLQPAHINKRILQEWSPVPKALYSASGKEEKLERKKKKNSKQPLL